MGWKKILYITILIIVLLLCLHMGYGAKDMGVLLKNYNIDSMDESFRYLLIDVYGKDWPEEFFSERMIVETDDTIVAYEIIEFLERYSIKPISKRKFGEFTSYDKGIWLSINFKNTINMEIHENTVYFMGKHYEVINQPVDFRWIDGFIRNNLNSSYSQE